MRALGDAVRQCPPGKAQLKKLIQALDQNMTLESAAEISEAEKLHMLESMLQHVSDFSTQWDFHLE